MTDKKRDGQYEKTTMGLSHFLLSFIAGDPGAWHHTEHKDRAWRFPDHLGVLQCVAGAGTEFWKCDLCVVHNLCAGAVGHPGKKPAVV